MQTNDTLMLRNNRFAELEENELKKAKLTSKKRKMMITLISIQFNVRMMILKQSKKREEHFFEDVNSMY
jgi:hypothetical protein